MVKMTLPELEKNIELEESFNEWKEKTNKRLKGSGLKVVDKFGFYFLKFYFYFTLFSFILIGIICSIFLRPYLSYIADVVKDNWGIINQTIMGG